jgi:hypothetical protein
MRMERASVLIYKNRHYIPGKVKRKKRKEEMEKIGKGRGTGI